MRDVQEETESCSHRLAWPGGDQSRIPFFGFIEYCVQEPTNIKLHNERGGRSFEQERLQEGSGSLRCSEQRLCVSLKDKDEATDADGEVFF